MKTTNKKENMKTKEEIKEWLLNNCINENGILNLSGLDFSDFEVDIDISNMKVKGNLHQGNQEVKGDLSQNSQEVKGNLYQSFQEVEGNLYQRNQKVEGDLYQNSQEVEGYLRQDKKIKALV